MQRVFETLMDARPIEINRLTAFCHLRSYQKAIKNVPPSFVILVADVNNERLASDRLNSSRNWINLCGNTRSSGTRRPFCRFVAVRSSNEAKSTFDLDIYYVFCLSLNPHQFRMSSKFG